MDVDIPQNEEAMETDSPIPLQDLPQLTRQDSVLDTDGDEVMDEGEGEEGEEEGEGMYEDIEIGAVEEGEGEGEEIETEEVEFEKAEGDYGEDVPIEEAEIMEETIVGEDVAEKDALRGEAAGGETAVDPSTDVTATTVSGIADGTIDIPQETTASTSSPTPHQPLVAETIAPEEKSKTVPAGEPEVDTTDEPGIVQESKDPFVEGNNDALEAGNEEEEGEEGEEGEEEYDLLTPSTLPPIILNLPNSRRALFNPFTTDDGTSLPLWFAERIEELCEGTLAQMWATIRSSLEEEGEESEEEMVVIEKLMDLKMGDVRPSTISPFLHCSRKNADRC